MLSNYFGKNNDLHGLFASPVLAIHQPHNGNSLTISAFKTHYDVNFQLTRFGNLLWQKNKTIYDKNLIRTLDKSLVRIFYQRAWRLVIRGLLHVGSGQKFLQKMVLKASGKRVWSEIVSRSPLDLLKRFILLQMSQIDKKSFKQDFPWNLSSHRPNSCWYFWKITKQVHWHGTQQRQPAKK